MSKTFDDHFAEVPDNMDDVSKWTACPCPTCGQAAEMRWTGLRTVAATGDENHAEKQWRPPAFTPPAGGPFVVQDQIGLPGDRIVFAAIDPATGITSGAHQERAHAEAEAKALNAAYFKGLEDGAFDAAHVVEAARLVHSARRDDTVLKRPKVPEQLLAAVNAHGGAIVSASECSRIEIMQAQDRGDYAEDFRGFGFVRRTPEWLERVELKQTYIGYGGRLIGSVGHGDD
jgi:hypothetical protein